MFNNQVGWISHVVVADLMSSSWKQGTEILRDEVIIHLIQHDQLCIVSPLTECWPSQLL